MLIKPLPRVVDQNHHEEDFLVQVNGLLVMPDFVIQIKDVLHDELLLIFGDFGDIVLGRRVPTGQHVVF